MENKNSTITPSSHKKKSTSPRKSESGKKATATSSSGKKKRSAPAKSVSRKGKKKLAKSVEPRKSKKEGPAKKAKKESRERNVKKIKEKTRKPHSISTSVKRERKRWSNIRNAQLEDRNKVAIEPLKRMLRQAYSDVSSSLDSKFKVVRMESKAEKLLLEQGIQILTEWCSETQRIVEIFKRSKPVPADTALASYVFWRASGMVAPPCQQSLSQRYSDFPADSVKKIAGSTLRAGKNFEALGLISADEGNKYYKQAKLAACKRKKNRDKAISANQ